MNVDLVTTNSIVQKEYAVGVIIDLKKYFDTKNNDCSKYYSKNRTVWHQW